MKKAIVLIMAALVLSLIFAATAGAQGLLGTKHASVRLGMYAIDDADDEGPFVKVEGQVPMKAGKMDLDIFANIFKADADLFEVTAFEGGVNFTLPVKTSFRTYAGASIRRVEVDYDVSIAGLPGMSATEKETQPNAWAGLEMGLGEGMVLNARAGLLDISDLFARGEILWAMSGKMQFLAGMEININESDMMAYAGMVIGF